MLASIQKIEKVFPIEGADRIEGVKVLGWDCVVKKGEFKEGDYCVYIEIDTIIPKRLLDNTYEGDEKVRLKTVKMKGQLSQGLVLPLDALNDYKRIPTSVGRMYNVNIGDDVTGVLGITKYEKAIPASMQGIAKGNFPGFLQKTDEVRIQSEPRILDQLRGKPYYITTKLDGTSATYYKFNGVFGVCSRNMELRSPYEPTFHEKSLPFYKVKSFLYRVGFLKSRKQKSKIKLTSAVNTYWEMAIKYKIEDWLPDGYAIQGEIVGEGIQKNPLQIKGHELYIFNVFEIKTRKYIAPDDFAELDDATVGSYGGEKLKIVPGEELGKEFNYTLDELLEKAKGNYPSGKRKEGIVVRSWDQSISFKVINNDYLLKDEE